MCTSGMYVCAWVMPVHMCFCVLGAGWSQQPWGAMGWALGPAAKGADLDTDVSPSLQVLAALVQASSSQTADHPPCAGFRICGVGHIHNGLEHARLK